MRVVQNRPAAKLRFQGVPGQTGFTLVELVAVVLVLTFMVLLGLPTLVRAKQRTKEANCQNNLRQLGFALQSYTEVNDGWLPGPLRLLAKPNYDRMATNELAWYVADRLGCPAPSPSPAVAPQLICTANNQEDHGTPGQPRTDYVLSAGRGLGGPPFGQPGSAESRPLSMSAVGAMTTPAECVAIADADKGNVNPTLPGWTALPYQPVHGKIRNQLYFDWHVGSKAW